MKILIQKIGAMPDALFPTPKSEDYIPGQDNGDVSLPIEYTIEGDLIENIEVGYPVSVWRSKRNGVEAPGYFKSSKVTMKTENTFNTLNSQYKYELL